MGEIGREREITHVDHDFLSDLIAGWGVVYQYVEVRSDGRAAGHAHS